MLTEDQLKKLRNAADEMRSSKSAPRGKNRVQLLTAALLDDGIVPSNFSTKEHLTCVVDAFNALSTKAGRTAFRKSPLYKEHGQNRKIDEILLSEL